MPLHRIYSAPGFFTEEEKSKIAQNITKAYTSALPAFYVVVLFIDVPENSFFVGGKSMTRFVRIVTQHLARTFDSPKMRDKFIEYLERCYAPIIKAKGEDVGWELHIEETPRETWRENGIAPPLPRTEAEKEWKRLNRPVPYTEIMNKL
ncbi:hypothetical protein M427DRAFT_151467 [Gonapodya prolifera JEL478]|uniref:Tautomerase cis-CaaD-like domain-containing protein n=1 Tax=Gonapodya prolifera (strain JEL478) TaxID=1344416 RepID=A0A139AXI0_GONPJ|nr:hypothetical protein M427DRAFT_151467 [Gonapodya prolifera JEL478]|eukprot:KXS21438.1 hypothetical protein M427DRAFT_151467 [Gonapodya prolifera JEL478]